MVYIDDPLTVVGDLHGQFLDLIKAFDVGGIPGENKYLFLGDYVDRGSQSTEILILLLALKLCFSNHIFMLRGNHESRIMTTSFNFREECLAKYDQDVYSAFMLLFDCLPVAAIINNRFFCIHGGMSPELKSVKDINKLHRFREPPENGLLCDLLWSDPVNNDSGSQYQKYLFNEQRGCSYFFGVEAVTKFLKNNKLLSIIRAHEVQYDGFKMHNWTGGSMPEVITLFSAPNYCGNYGNKAAVIKFAVR